MKENDEAIKYNKCISVLEQGLNYYGKSCCAFTYSKQVGKAISRSAKMFYCHSHQWQSKHL